MYDLIVQIVDRSGGNDLVIQITWIQADSNFDAQMKADKIAENAPIWLGGDMIRIMQHFRVLAWRQLGGSWCS